MRRRPAQTKSKREPTIALINIVFLMLIFFLIAGTIAPPTEAGIELVTLADLDGSAPAETLAIYPGGRVVWDGVEVTPETFTPPESHPDTTVIRLLPDRNLPAWKLLKIATALEAGGATDLRVVTERALK